MRRERFSSRVLRPLLLIAVSAATVSAGSIDISVTARAQPGAFAPLTQAEFEALADHSRLVVRRIDLAASTDIDRIGRTGVVIWTREPQYAIVAGDEARISAVGALGFSLSSPSEADYKLRFFRTRISTRDDYERLRTLMSDVGPVVEFPGRVVGRAYDYQIQWAKDAGYVVDTCISLADCNRQ